MPDLAVEKLNKKKTKKLKNLKDVVKVFGKKRKLSKAH